MRKKALLTLILMALAIVTAVAADKFTLVIDAGHGGHDSGAPGAISKEKDINLKVALAFGKMVERNCRDVRVVYTRTTDVFVPLSERANIANRNKADLFISVHTNALDGGKISRGFETYTLGMHRANDNLNVAKRENSVILIEKDYKQRYAGFDPKSSESYIMFELMQDKNMAKSVDLAKLIQSEVCTISGRVNKGVHQAGFLVLRETSMPSCLIELGFITTPDEEQFLNTEEGQNLMAKGIYNAFLKYKKQYGSTGVADVGRSSTTEEPVLAQNTTTPSPSTPKASASRTTPSPSNPKTSTSRTTPSSGTPKASASRTTPPSSTPKASPATPRPSAGSSASSAQRPFVEDDTTSVTQYAEQRRVRQPQTTSTSPTTRTETPAPTPSKAETMSTTPVAPPPPPAPEATARTTTALPPPPAPEAPATTATTLPPPPPPTETAPVASVAPSSAQPVAVSPDTSVAPSGTPSPTPPSAPAEPGGRPIFKVQIAANSQQLPVDHAVFKGLQGIDMYVENDLYKYTVGASPDLNEINQLRRLVAELFPQAFVIAFRDGVKIPMAQAMKEYRNANQSKKK